MQSLQMDLKACARLLKIIQYNYAISTSERLSIDLTKNSQLNIAIDLQKIMRNLASTAEEKFTKKLDVWYEKYKDTLLEKSINSITKKASYTHPKVVSAYRSLRRNIPYLFTYKKYTDFKIDNTTNTIDGGVFSPIKKLMNVHAGFNKSLKLKIVDFYLVYYHK